LKPGKNWKYLGKQYSKKRKEKSFEDKGGMKYKIEGTRRKHEEI
jgi:hypothetical protein